MGRKLPDQTSFEAYRRTTDAHGDEVLVGLTRDESEDFVALIARERLSDNEQDRYLWLYEKHQAAVIRLGGAESELKMDKPTMH